METVGMGFAFLPDERFCGRQNAFDVRKPSRRWIKPPGLNLILANLSTFK